MRDVLHFHKEKMEIAGSVLEKLLSDICSGSLATSAGTENALNLKKFLVKIEGPFSELFLKVSSSGQAVLSKL